MKFKSSKNILHKKTGLGRSLSSSYTNKKKLIIASTIVLCLIFAIAFLYQPAKTYYIELRQQQKLQYQYELLKQNNDKLSDNIDQLQTEDGIKQQAIDTLGLIQEGENLGYTSIYDVEDGRDRSSSSTSSKVSYKTIKAPQTWYSPILNFVFNVSD